MLRSVLRRLPVSPSVRPLHAVTFLFAVPVFSISFLVFLNSSLSFLLSNLFHVAPSELGSVVGTLGFVDELVAVVTTPLWGVVSDGRLGTRGVTAIGYLAISLSLVLFVQLQSVYPGLVFGRIVFALGGAAVTTMVSAILPEMTRPTSPSSSQRVGRGVGEDEYEDGEEEEGDDDDDGGGEEEGEGEGEGEDGASTSPPTGQLAGVVGLLTGLGALLALGVLLRLPAVLSDLLDIAADQAIRLSYHIVAGVAFVAAAWCYLGLAPPRNPATTNAWLDIKAWVWTRIWGGDPVFLSSSSPSPPPSPPPAEAPPGGIRGLGEAARLGLSDGRIGVAYVGGFVARASSVGISLFIPLYVNHWFISTGRCQPTLPELTKEQCKEAYILASMLTGTSQLTALLLAPAYGLLTDRLYASPRLRNLPLVLSSALGIVGFTLFSLLQTPRCTAAFVYAALAGASQIGAIVASLGMLSRGIVDVADAALSNGERRSLLVGGRGRRKGRQDTREAFKGCIAGVYSLFGAAAILLLTKAGGRAFDGAAGAPFWMLAGFNAVLAVVASGNGIWTGMRP